jgi:DNA-binding transcriptional LysR family regulator
LGVVGSLPIMPPSLSGERLTGIAFVVVAARDHPLASAKGTIAKSELAKHVQLVLTDRTSLSKGREFGVMSPQTWRLADLFAKHAFLLNVVFGPLHNERATIKLSPSVVPRLNFLALALFR